MVEQIPESFQLSVRGTVITCEKVLFDSVNDTALGAMFSGRHALEQKDGLPSIDRDPIIFNYVLYYLRNKQMPDLTDELEKSSLLTELRFWTISSHSIKMFKIFAFKPKFADPLTLEKWTQLRVISHQTWFSDVAVDEIKEVGNFIGQMNDQGQKHGIGRVDYGGYLYEGTFQQDAYHGFGRRIWNIGYYEGAWVKSKMHGHGKRKLDDRQIEEEGIWENDVFKS